ncbi:MAG TPA: error-prone DNA polymerase, partial [Pseudolabrys sp.]|nr:error-prone DNA polymerase [Pseudolabrys sp.]
MRYVEFAVTSNFSFLRGASHPEEMLAQAAHLGMAGMGLCDRNSVAGVVRAHLLKRETKLALRYHPGARLVFADGTPDILVYPRDRAAWGRLCRLLTTGNLRAEKGHCALFIEDLLAHIDGIELIVMEKSTNDSSSNAVSPPSPPSAFLSLPPPERGRLTPEGCRVGVNSSFEKEDDPHPNPPPFRGREKKEQGGRERAIPAENLKSLLPLLNEAAPGRVRLAASMLYRGDDRARLAKLAECARPARVPLIAVNDVLYHVPARRKLQDVVTCIREHTTIEVAGRKLGVNAERHLKTPEEMARLFRDAPDAIAETMQLSRKLTFSLDELAFEYPEETREGFTTPQDALVHYTYEGANVRYPGGIPDKVGKSLEHELALIARLQYAPYFLTVHDIVRFARSQNILCQGRGSAANSAVCYCLGV